MKIWFRKDPLKRGIRSRLSRTYVTGLVRKVLKELKLDDAEVGLVLTGDARMRRLNRIYRGIDRSTDVLAFALQEDPMRVRNSSAREKKMPYHLGDVVISLETATRQARQRGHSLKRELAVLIIHGLLHLAGYDHERSEPEARAMMRKEKKLLALAS